MAATGMVISGAAGNLLSPDGRLTADSPLPRFSE